MVEEVYIIYYKNKPAWEWKWGECPNWLGRNKRMYRTRGMAQMVINRNTHVNTFVGAMVRKTTTADHEDFTIVRYISEKLAELSGVIGNYEEAKKIIAVKKVI